MNRGPVESILIASADAARRDPVAGHLRRAGHAVRTVSSLGEAAESFTREPAVVIADLDLPGGGGRELMRLLRARHPDAVLVMVCAAPTVEETVALMKEGVFHVLGLPLNMEQLGVVAQKACEHARLSRGNRDLKSQLDLSEKLAMIGRLASGVAHELNNPLDGVRRYVRMTKEGLASERQELADYLDRAMSGLSRMAGIVRQLLTFSRNVVLENEEENLKTMVEEVVRTLAPSGAAGAPVIIDNPYLDIRVPRAMFQVFANLVKNALDAVEAKKGRGLVRISVRREGAGVEVSVADNGIGIPAGNLRRVFEPFFTTKEVGKGTGLGLPISARIVERCGGTIRIESEEGVGTTLTVALPLPAVTAGTKVLTESHKS